VTANFLHDLNFPSAYKHDTQRGGGNTLKVALNSFVLLYNSVCRNEPFQIRFETDELF